MDDRKVPAPGDIRKFLVVLCHELRTLLNAVQGMAAHAIHAGATGDVRECLEHIRITTVRLVSLLNGILELSKIETGEFDLDDRPLDLWDLVGHSEYDLLFVAAQRGLDFFWTVEFLYWLGYEVRGTRNTVQGMTDIAFHWGATGDVRECLERMEINTVSMVGLVNDILDYSKIKKGDFDLDDRPHDLWDLVDPIGDSLTFKAAQKGLDFFWTVDVLVPHQVRGDVRRLRQILSNLLRNAIQFTDHGHVRAVVSLEGGRLIFHVEDSGIGITSKDITRVGAGKYGRSAHAPDYQGTGLGMIVIQSLVQQVGGAVEIKNEVGVGHSIRVSLPLQAIPNASPPIQPYEVWVFLANELTRRHVVQILGAAGYPVVEVTEKTPTGAPSLLICDVDNPACRRLASVLQPQGAKILAITSWGHRSEGADDMDARLVRPFGRRRLLDVIARLQKPTQSPASDITPPREGGIVQHRLLVLVVDDHADNRHLAVHLFGKAGYEVCCAENGALGYLAASKKDFALILMDIEMPQMDGLEATRRIRALEEQEGRPRTPIITLVADPGQGSRQSCLDAGMDEYVTKPIQRKRMLELVSAWVDPRPVALIVDGSVDTRAIVRRYIERDRRIRPVCVGDGEAALRLVHRRPFDVVVVSKEMPRMDGLELLREILALDPGARCILLTRDSDTETRRRAKEAGALGFVTKPVERPFFIETLLEVLGMPFSPKES